MRKNYIYILIGMLCFLSFSGDVKADNYKVICEYESFYEVSGDKYGYNINIQYDASNKDKPYKVEAEKMKANNFGQYERINYELFSFKKGGNVNGKIETTDSTFGLSKIYLYASISETQCPSNVAIKFSNLVLESANYKTTLCFYNEEKYGNRCSQIESDMKKVSGGKASYNNSYNNLKDGQTCTKTVDLKSTNNSAYKCNIEFKYNASNNNLKISYKYDLNDEINELSTSSSNFECGKVASGNTQQGMEVLNTAKIFLSNTSVGLSAVDTLITSRSEFDKKYLEEWNSTGECPSLIADQIGDSNRTTSTTNFYLLFDDAAESCKNDGCANVAVDNLVALPSWDHDWSNWGTNKTEYEDCEGLLGENIISMINDVLTYVKVLVPIALIAFGIMDFTKAVFSTKEDSMKKAQMNFIKRLIMAVVIFIVPSIINLLLNTVDGIWAHINNSACNIWR